jgi:hypothetical protein
MENTREGKAATEVDMGGGGEKGLEGFECTYYLNLALSRTAWKSAQFTCQNLNLLSCALFNFSLSLYGFHMFLLGFISILPQLAWDKRLCVVAVVVVVEGVL